METTSPKKTKTKVENKPAKSNGAVDSAKAKTKGAKSTKASGTELPEGSEQPQQTQTGLRYQLENLKTQVESRLSDSNKVDTDDQLDLKLEPNTFYRVSNRTEEQIKLYNNANELLETIDGNTAKALDGKRVLKVNQRSFKQLVGENKISYKPLELDQDTDYVVSNLTAKRISIKHNYYKSTGLFLPAFGSRTLKGKILLEHEYTDWEHQGLIKVEVVNTPTEDESAYAILGLLIIALGLFLVISVPTAILSQTISWKTIGIVTAVSVTLMIISLALAGRIRSILTNLNSWLKLLPGIALVLATGIGLPILIVYFFGDGKTLLDAQTVELGSLGRLMQVAFISIASMLPAFLFYLFGRQQVGKQKENFYREAMLLDPNVWSDSEAKNKYEPLLNSVFDTGNSPFSVLLLLISTALLVMGWVITLSPIGSAHNELGSLIEFFVPVATPFTFGFLGAYFFTVNMIYRRYVRADLTTKTYAYITMRLLITLVLVWTVSTLPQSQAGSAFETGVFIVAFVIGIFPETGMALIQDQFKLITKQKQEIENFSLTELEGINLYDRARLLEEGIENIENLAHHNLMELIARTRIPTPRLVDMFDQAILYLHLGLEIDSEDEEAIKNEKDDPRKLLKRLGIRTATDLIKCRNEITEFKDDEKKYKSLINKLDVIVTALKDDEWLNYVQNWRSYSSLQEKAIDNPFKFYEKAAQSHQSWLKSTED